MNLIKKRKISMILLIFLLTFFSASVQAKIIKSSIENASVRKYISEVKYSKTDHKSYIRRYLKSSSDELSYPAPVTVSFPKTKGNVTIRLYGKNFHVSYVDPGETGKLNIYNLTPGIHYSYKIYDEKKHKIAEGTVIPSGRVRMIYAKGVKNVRDLGGWKTTDGHQIRYGLLYRGRELDYKHSVSKAGLAVFQDILKICYDIDLRSKKETKGIKSSPIGKNVKYYRYGIYGYKPDKKENRIAFQKLFRKIFQAVEKNKPVYFHCVAGADRTATVAFLLEGLMGMSESDLAKEYELTSFYKLRQRTFRKYQSMLEKIKKYPGKNLQKKFEAHFLSLGFTKGELARFRKKMLI